MYLVYVYVLAMYEFWANIHMVTLNNIVFVYLWCEILLYVINLFSFADSPSMYEIANHRLCWSLNWCPWVKSVGTLDSEMRRSVKNRALVAEKSPYLNTWGSHCLMHVVSVLSLLTSVCTHQPPYPQLVDSYWWPRLSAFWLCNINPLWWLGLVVLMSNCVVILTRTGRFPVCTQ